MSRVQTIKKNLVDGDMAKMFNQMLGDGDPDIIGPKFERLRRALGLIAKVLDNVATGPLTGLTQFKPWWDEFKTMSTRVAALDAITHYGELKEHRTVKILIASISSLAEYRDRLDNDKWIYDHPGISFVPFIFTEFDVKALWNNTNSESARAYALKIIGLFYKNCTEVYTIVSSPDVNLQKFVSLVMDSIDKLRKIPKLSRCQRAFNKIQESVRLLESNFDQYYKDMKQSSNPNIIMESFITDVSKTGNMDITLMREFKVIISFYQNEARTKVKDPKYAKMLDEITSKMSVLEKEVETKGDTDAEGDDATQ